MKAESDVFRARLSEPIHDLQDLGPVRYKESKTDIQGGRTLYRKAVSCGRIYARLWRRNSGVVV